MNILAPSILAADFLKLGEQIKEAEDAGMLYIHFDVMDGVFVPSISFGMPVLSSVRKGTKKYIDVHLMITEPERYVEGFCNAGADGLTIHLEACKHIPETLDAIKKLHMRAGIAINPETPVSELIPYLKQADMILIMTVHPGFGGQKYMDECTEKIRQVRQMLDDRGLNTDIEIDGGVTRENVMIPIEAGANIIVAGSAIFNDHIAENVRYFNEKLFI